MSKEKRHMRLLSPRGSTPHGPSDDARDWPRVSPDEELGAALAHWRAPAPSRALDARLLQSFRAQAQPRASLWKRALAMRVSIPVPALAAAFVLLVLVPLAVAVRAVAVRAKLPAQVTSPPAREALPDRIVEVPVYKDRVVTRVVYVERAQRRDEARSAATTAAQSSTRTEARAAEAIKGRARTASMAGFKPADDVKLTIIKGERFER
jgi:hypothetical protein